MRYLKNFGNIKQYNNHITFGSKYLYFRNKSQYLLSNELQKITEERANVYFTSC